MSEFQVGDLVIHQNGEEIAIVKRVICNSDASYDLLDVYTIYDLDETMKCPTLWKNRKAEVWRIFTEETVITTRWRNNNV